MSIRPRATATTNALERAPLVGAERLRNPEIDHQRMAACRLWRLRDAAGEDGADNAGERNHRQHGDETAAAKAIAPRATPALPPRKVEALTTPEPCPACPGERTESASRGAEA